MKIVNFEHILHLVLMFSLLTLSGQMAAWNSILKIRTTFTTSTVFIANFKQALARRVT